MTEAEKAPPAILVLLCAIATGALAANLYYAQPLIASIAAELSISPRLAGSIVSIGQVGFGIGLFFFVSLADLVENRALALATLALTAFGLLAAGLSRSAIPFFVASLVIGLTSTGAQILVPFMARLAPPGVRGRVVGTVMAGLLTGVMLARPVSLFVASAFGWRAIFIVSAVLMIVIALALARVMPRYRPTTGKNYAELLASTPALFGSLDFLRWRSLYQGLLFAAFQIFWTAAPLALADRFALSQRGIGLFALAGAGGALAAPVAGRLADRGYSTLLTIFATGAAALAFWATIPAVSSYALIAFAVLAVVLDGAVQTNHIASQRIIFAAPAEVRGRVNALYMTCLFIGGAAGSFAATGLYHRWGWAGDAVAGGAAGFVALVMFGVEKFAAASRGRSAGKECL
jgi:predicted MFS family arabinose efflux permease